VALEVIDPLTKVWKPHQKQVEFIEIPDSIFEAMYGGAAGGGKSELLIMLPIIRGWHKHPKFHGIIFRETFPQLEESIIPRADAFYSLVGAKYNETKHVWKFPSGAIIRASYLEKEKDAREHDTAEYHYAAFDELTAFHEFVYKYITSRVRSSIPGIPALVRSATNPGNKGHLWVRKRFVDPAPDGRTVIYDTKSQTKRIFIPAKLEDNPYLNEADPGYGFRLEILPEAERRAKKDGDWYVFSGMVFEEWRVRPLGDEPPQARHVIEPFDVPEWWPRILAVDWGYTANTWAGWAAVTPDARCILYREYVARKTDIAIWGADIRRHSQFELDGIVDIVMDPSAWAKRGDPKTISEQFEEASGFRPNKADNDRLGGKMLMHEFLRWKPKPPRYIPPEGYDPDKEQHIYRNFGSTAALDYKKMFDPEPPEKNLPKLQVFNHCKNFIDVIPVCTYDSKEGRTAEDVAEFDGDDPYDGGRYLIKAFHRYVNLSYNNDQKRQRISTIMNRFSETGDYTMLHRQMEALEKKSPKVVGIHRGRRRGVHFASG
jgi:hypothetical protein